MKQKLIAWYRQLKTTRADEVKLDFAVSLAAAIEAEGISRQEFAKRVGVSSARITKTLRGDTNLTIESMDRLASAVGKELHVHLSAPSSPGIDATAPQAAPTREADPVLTTEQAARLVGVSRSAMAKLIDSGAVELHQMAGKQRRVRRSAVIRWQKAERSRQTKSLKRLAADQDEEIFSS